MSRRPQKGKGGKRGHRWHKGASAADRWARVNLPDVGSGADPTAGRPLPVVMGPGATNRGDAA